MAKTTRRPKNKAARGIWPKIDLIVKTIRQKTKGIRIEAKIKRS